MITKFPEINYLNGHEGVHIGDGVYKVKQPFRIKRFEWINARENSGCAIIGDNYSEDYSECDVVYFGYNTWGDLGKISCRLNEEYPNKYWYS